MYCQALVSENVKDIKTWMVLPSLVRSFFLGAYFFDKNSQTFINLRGHGSKQPLVYRGNSASTESSDPPLIDGYYRISKGKFFTRRKREFVGDIYSDPISVTTHIVKVRFRKLPVRTPGQDTSELFYTFTSDKKMEIYVTFDKRFTFKVGSERKTTKPFNFINFKWYHLRITYTRGIYPAYPFDCSVEIEIVGVGRDGHELRCNLIYVLPS